MPRAFDSTPEMQAYLASIGIPWVPDTDYYHGLVYLPECQKCPLRIKTRVDPCGPIPARICIVGEVPGTEEVKEGRGFVGPSGQLLWDWAGHYGLKREDIWITNSHLCRDTKIRLKTGALLERDVVAQLANRCCLKRLIAELIVVTRGNPQAVITPVGNSALGMLLQRPKASVFAYRGSVNDIDLIKLWLQLQTEFVD